MKKLLLTSSFQKVGVELKKILPAEPKDLTVVFIPTAADVYEDKWFMEADRKVLVDMGFKIMDLALKDKTKDELEKTLKQADIIFVGGGNTFYLLDHARKSGFTELVPKLVESGTIYVGSSAGSYLACPTIEAASWKNQDKNIVDLKDFKALNLVPFILFVHYKPEHDSLLNTMLTQTNYEVKILNDEQAILVSDNSYSLVGKGAEIKF